MISHKHKCIFIHIPKTAGQSIEHVFLKLNGLNWQLRSPLLLRYNDKPELGPISLAHLSYKEYVDCGYLSDELFQEYYKFSFVRNPWSRIVSTYKYLGYSQLVSFEKFILYILPRIYDKYKMHFRPQTDYIYNGNKCMVDFVGRFEKLQSDFNVVCNALKIEKYDLPFINKSSAKRSIRSGLSLLKKDPSTLKHISFSNGGNGMHVELFNQKTRKIVDKMYEKDIDNFKYSFKD